MVERRNTIPILSNVLIEAKDGALGLTATDMKYDLVRTAFVTSADTDAAALEALLAEMQAELASRLAADGFAEAEMRDDQGRVVARGRQTAVPLV